MALIKCPECGLSISDKAAACPNCGYPLQPAPEPVEYELTRSNPSESKLGKFLRACVWVDGICLIIWTIIVAFCTGEAFDLGDYFTTLVTYALYGCLIWCFASLSDDVHNISSALTSLQLQGKAISSSPVGIQHSVPLKNEDSAASTVSWLTIATKDDQSLLMSKSVLAFKPYDTSGTNSLWEHASLRRWLNEDFYAKAFSDDEKQSILPTQLDSTDESSEADNVFLLNIDEAKTYLDDQTMKADNWWWLRNSDSNVHTIAYVSSKGDIRTGCTDLTANGGVRPCIWIKNKPV